MAVGVYGWGGEEFGDVGFVPLFGRLGAPVKIVFGIEPEAGHLGGLAAGVACKVHAADDAGPVLPAGGHFVVSGEAGAGAVAAGGKACAVGFEVVQNLCNIDMQPG